MTAAMILSPQNEELINGQVQEGLTVLRAHKQLIDQVVGSMSEGTHYGASFPGDKKMNLLKPGADYLCVAFKLVPEFTQTEKDLGMGHREYSSVCTIKTFDGQRIVANGVGTCSTMESKYRWRYAKTKCPTCEQETVIKGKEDFGGGWLCWGKKGGCGAKFSTSDPAIVNQVRGKIENPDPADVWNTVMKISKKRAFVDAIITATGCSDQFTQDAEDHAEEGATQERKEEKRSQAPTSQPHNESTSAAGGTGTPAAPKPADGLADNEELNLFLKLGLAIKDAKEPVTLGEAWKEVMAKQKSLTREHMLKLRDQWQARIAEDGMKQD